MPVDRLCWHTGNVDPGPSRVRASWNIRSDAASSRCEGVFGRYGKFRCSDRVEYGCGRGGARALDSGGIERRGKG